MDTKTIKLRVPTETELEQLVIREEEIRMSKEYQEECTKVKDIPNGWLDVTRKMQEKLVSDFGFVGEPTHTIACNMLRRARYIFPENKIFTTVPVYVRQNKANDGTLNIGDDPPDIKLHNLDGSIVHLKDIIDDKINIFFSGSET